MVSNKQFWVNAVIFVSTLAWGSIGLAFTISGSSGVNGWHTDELRFAVSTAGCASQESRLNTAIDAAADLWSKIPNSRLKVTRGDSVTTTAAQAKAVSPSSSPLYGNMPNPLIVCDPNMTSTIGSNANNIPAATSFIAPGSVINFAYMVLNAESGRAANITNLDDTILAIIIAHEMGHALGLGHTSNLNSIMYFDATDKENLTLSQDDMDAIAYLYPRTEGGGGKPFGCGTVDASNGSGPSSGNGAATLLTLFLMSGVGTWIFKRGSYKTDRV